MTTLHLSRPATAAFAGVGIALAGLFGLAGEMSGRFPHGMTVSLVFVATLAIAVGALLVGARRGAAVHPETKLPSLHALAREARHGPTVLAIVKINGRDTLEPLPADERALLVRRIAERVSLGTGGMPVYHVAPAALAWRVPADERDHLDDRFAGLAAVMRAPIICAGRPIEIAINFGVVEGSGGTVPVLVEAGIAAARRARAAGRRWERAIADDLSGRDWQQGLVAELDRAIASGAIWVAYQPKLDIASDRVVGAEALVRWQHPRRGNVPPDVFVPLIERHGRAAALTAHVLDTALADAASWRRIGRPIGVAVNVSATLLGSDGLVPEIAAALARHRIPPDMLTLEVTESAVIASADEAIARLDELGELGVRISIDDYGTGQSTMTYLKHFPASELKIDKSFVQGLVGSRADMILVRSTIDLAHALEMKVVAEGVEDQPCLDLLRELGCDVAQGWHIGKPMPAENLALMQAWQRAA